VGLTSPQKLTTTFVKIYYFVTVLRMTFIVYKYSIRNGRKINSELAKSRTASNNDCPMGTKKWAGRLPTPCPVRLPSMLGCKILSWEGFKKATP